ncbi:MULTISPECIES: asparagine synthase-related protein [unclassified Kitasatospora]|uniref:asparagine synthase-related protein n=1 Tax=unclassified Kitasatospora TaxID=2633591 RepID=UPI0033EE040B
MDFGEQYFVVLPDQQRAVAAADRLPPDATPLMSHRSGRPCLAGRISAGQFLKAEAGDTVLAVVGVCSATQADLDAQVERITDPAQLDELSLRWSGSYHLIASVGGRLRVQGTASGLRRISHGSLDGLTVAADRTDLLAELIGSTPDVGALALRLLENLPHPLPERSLWQGVETVPPGSWLSVPTDGRGATVHPWWRSPQAELSLAEAAVALRTELAAAVDARLALTTRLTGDFSGGLDSTSLLALAAQDTPVVGFTMANDDQADDDLHWAELAAAELPHLKHVVFGSHEVPGFFAGLTDLEAVTDEPSVALLSTPRLRAMRELAVEHGSTLHLDGLGGDQALTGHFAYYHDLLRRHPLMALRRLRTIRQLSRLDLGASLRTLLDGSSYPSWFTAELNALTSGRVRRRNRVFDWGGGPAFPDWLTPEAAELVTAELRAAAERARPLDPSRGRHSDLAAIQDAGLLVRSLHQVVAQPGYSGSSPFLDDRVIAACLAARPEERVTPWEFKPLIKSAMAGVLPRRVLERRTKADGAMIAAEGFARHRLELDRLWQTSRLAELGLVDPAPLRELCRRPYASATHAGRMPVALSTELWARDRLA